MVDIFNSTQANNRNFLVNSNLWLMIFFYPFLSGRTPTRRWAGDGRGYRTPIDYSGIYVPNQSSELSLRYPDNYNIQFLNPPPQLSLPRTFSRMGYLFPWICGWDLPPGLWGSSILCLPSPPKIRSSSKFRGRGEESNLCSSKPFPIPSYTL